MYKGTQNNIFLLHQIHSAEDFFTAALECMLNHCPNYGQALVETLVPVNIAAHPKFLQAFDHPFFDGYSERPDFLIKCDAIDIICEHKLDSMLGAQQLERYLKLAQAQIKPTYLSFIAKEEYSVAVAVKSSDHYLSAPTRSHFLWQDLYPLFIDAPDRLGQDFQQLMATLGMTHPIPIKHWEHLFEQNHTQCEVFRNLLKEALQGHFKPLGAKCSKDGEDKWGCSTDKSLKLECV